MTANVDSAFDSCRSGAYSIEWRSGDQTNVLSSDPRKFRLLHDVMRRSGRTGDLVVVDESGTDRIRQSITPDQLAD